MIDPKTASLHELRDWMGQVIKHNPQSGRFWDLITCLRGPDSPSERPDMTPEERNSAYAGRRKRKADTVEVIRAQAFGGAVGGSARYRVDRDYVTLPPMGEWDHFDKHVERAARAIGLEVKIKEPSNQPAKPAWEVKVEGPNTNPYPELTTNAPSQAYKYWGGQWVSGTGGWSKKSVVTTKPTLEKLQTSLAFKEKKLKYYEEKLANKPGYEPYIDTVNAYKNGIASIKEQMKGLVDPKCEPVATVPVLVGSKGLINAYNNLLVADGQGSLSYDIETPVKGLADDDIPF